LYQVYPSRLCPIPSGLKGTPSAKSREIIDSWSVEASGLRRWLGWREGIIRSDQTDETGSCDLLPLGWESLLRYGSRHVNEFYSGLAGDDLHRHRQADLAFKLRTIECASLSASQAQTNDSIDLTPGSSGHTYRLRRCWAIILIQSHIISGVQQLSVLSPTICMPVGNATACLCF